MLHGQFAIRLLNVGTMLRPSETMLELCCAKNRHRVSSRVLSPLQALMTVFYDAICISVYILPWL